MPTNYNNNFSFNPKDIELIEYGLRSLGEHYDLVSAMNHGEAPQSDSFKDKNSKLKEINQLLGKIHNKKIFYSQTHRAKNVPLG